MRHLDLASKATLWLSTSRYSPPPMGYPMTASAERLEVGKFFGAESDVSQMMKLDPRLSALADLGQIALPIAAADVLPMLGRQIVGIALETERVESRRNRRWAVRKVHAQ